MRAKHGARQRDHAHGALAHAAPLAHSGAGAAAQVAVRAGHFAG